MKKTITLSLILTLCSTQLVSYAQLSTGSLSTSDEDTTVQTLTQPSQTTIFFTDPDKAKQIVETADTTYMSESDTSFSADNAQKAIDNLDEGVKDLRKQIIVLDRKYGTDDKQYLETRTEVISIINEIEKTKDTLASSIKKIFFYQKDILTSVDKVNAIRSNLKETKGYIEKFAQFMYKLNNEYYNNDGTLDELKLFIKSDGEISEQLSNTALVETVMQKMNTLMETLSTQEKETIAQIKNSNKNRTEIRKIIADYQKRLKDLQEQRKFLSDYLTLYESNKVKMSKELANLFSTRSEVYGDINTTVADINDKKYTNVSFDIKAKLEELNNTEAYATRDTNAAPLSWPIYPVVQISKFFDDEEFKTQYKMPFNGIEIPAEQSSPLYAVDEGLVYKIANKEGVGLNWILVIQKNNIMTVYLYPNKIIVNEGDIIRRGQVIGYSGGEPGTKGAGFVAGGPNLTFMVIDNGKFVNPIDYLDLSTLQDKSKIPTGYKFKYLKDKYNLPRELYAVKSLPGDSVDERRTNFLNTYAVGVYRSPEFWYDASEGTNIDVDVGICIGFAESSLGRNLTTSNNIGNVDNNDGGKRVSYTGPMVGARLIYTTLNNKYLGKYNILLDYNGYGNPDGANYATSKYNWQNNVTKCLSMIKGYYVPDDYPVRVGPKPDGQGAIDQSTVSSTVYR